MTAADGNGIPMQNPDAESRLAFAGEAKIDQDDGVTSVYRFFP